MVIAKAVASDVQRFSEALEGFFVLALRLVGETNAVVCCGNVWMIIPEGTCAKEVLKQGLVTALT